MQLNLSYLPFIKLNIINPNYLNDILHLWVTACHQSCKVAMYKLGFERDKLLHLNVFGKDIRETRKFDIIE